MGGTLSKRSITQQCSSVPSSSYSWGHNSYTQSPYVQPNQEYAPQQSYAPTPQSYGSLATESRRKLERKYSKINDDYRSLEQVI